MKIIFFGTPEFAVPSLNELIKKYEVVAVVTQLDKPSGRNSKLKPSAVKEFALLHNIPVLQYEKVRKDGIEDLKKIDADVMVTVAYGQILSKEILDMTKYGVINVHGSLLPKLRGSSPIQWSIINGDKVTGITILKSDVGIDNGPIILQKEVDIKENETSAELFGRLSVVGANCLIEALGLIENNSANYSIQNEKNATVCKMLSKELSKLDFNCSIEKLKNLINGINSWPIANVFIDGKKFKIIRAINVTNKFDIILDKYKNGEVIFANNKQGLIIKVSDGLIQFAEIIPENSNKMTDKSYLNGKSIKVGSICE